MCVEAFAAQLSVYCVDDGLARVGEAKGRAALASPQIRFARNKLAAIVQLELLNAEIFYALNEVVIFIERWRPHSKTVKPPSLLQSPSPAPKGHVSPLLDALARRSASYAGRP